MTDHETPIVTVWRETTPAESKSDKAENRQVFVTTDRPLDEKARVVYELHVPRESLEATEDPHIFRVKWADAQDWPYQVIAR